MPFDVVAAVPFLPYKVQATVFAFLDLSIAHDLEDSADPVIRSLATQRVFAVVDANTYPVQRLRVPNWVLHRFLVMATQTVLPAKIGTLSYTLRKRELDQIRPEVVTGLDQCAVAVQLSIELEDSEGMWFSQILATLHEITNLQSLAISVADSHCHLDMTAVALPRSLRYLTVGIARSESVYGPDSLILYVVPPAFPPHLRYLELVYVEIQPATFRIPDELQVLKLGTVSTDFSPYVNRLPLLLRRMTAFGARTNLSWNKALFVAHEAGSMLPRMLEHNLVVVKGDLSAMPTIRTCAHGERSGFKVVVRQKTNYSGYAFPPCDQFTVSSASTFTMQTISIPPGVTDLRVTRCESAPAQMAEFNRLESFTVSHMSLCLFQLCLPEFRNLCQLRIVGCKLPPGLNLDNSPVLWSLFSADPPTSFSEESKDREECTDVFDYWTSDEEISDGDCLEVKNYCPSEQEDSDGATTEDDIYGLSDDSFKGEEQGEQYREERVVVEWDTESEESERTAEESDDQEPLEDESIDRWVPGRLNNSERPIPYPLEVAQDSRITAALGRVSLDDTSLLLMRPDALASPGTLQIILQCARSQMQVPIRFAQ